MLDSMHEILASADYGVNAERLMSNLPYTLTAAPQQPSHAMRKILKLAIQLPIPLNEMSPGS